MDDFKSVLERYSALKSERDKYRPLWNDISKYAGISVDTDYQQHNQTTKSKQLDEFIDDPTSAISVNQFGDYLIGIMWGTGDNVFKLIPSRYVLEYADSGELSNYYDFATDQTLYHMNHADAGLNNCLKQYSYDQAAFGTSGVGSFPNHAFVNRVADNAFIFRQYGVDNICIDEGKSGSVEYIFATYHWRVSRIVGEFCCNGGKPDDSLIAKLPDEIKECWEKGKMNEEFTIVFAVMPRTDFNPKYMGKRGTRYCGMWFMDGSNKQVAPFAEEDFAEKPIAIARMIKVRGEIWGRSSGTLLLSTIRAVNFMLSTGIEIIEKMSNPSLGMLNNAIFGDSVLDTSPNGLTIFNSALAAGQQPTFPLYDVGDPSALMTLLIPYLNDKITSAFKVDALLDFNSAKDMTATESLHRYAIRGKSLSGILTQQKTELLEPLVKRCVSILQAMKELGANPVTEELRVKQLKAINKSNRVIPEAVLRVIQEGRPWYEIKFNNELEKLTRTEAVQALVQVLQAVTGIAALYPQIIEAVDWYKLLKDINNNLDANNQILFSEKAFKEKIAEVARQQQAMMAIQAGQAGAQIQKDGAQANKSNAEAQVVRQ